MSVYRIRLRSLLSPGQACHYGEVARDASSTTGLHGHDFVEIFWVASGGGSEFSGGQWRPLQAGDIVFVHRDDVHEIRGEANCAPLTLRNVAFFAQAWSQLRSRYGEALAERFEGPPEARRLRVPHLIAALDEAAGDLRRGHIGPLDRDRFLLRLDQVLQSAPPASPAVPEWLASAMQEMQQPPHLERGMASFIDLCGRSHEHVARTCRACLGRSPTQVVSDLRLDAAASLLASTDRPVLAVCYDSGFGHVGHFHEQFKRRFGLTPRRYRINRRATLAPPR